MAITTTPFQELVQYRSTAGSRRYYFCGYPLPENVIACVVMYSDLNGTNEVWWRLKGEVEARRYQVPDGVLVRDHFEPIYAAIKLSC